MRFFYTITFSWIVCAGILASSPLWGIPPSGRITLETLRKPTPKLPFSLQVRRTAYIYEVGRGNNHAKTVLRNRALYRKELRQVSQLYNKIQHAPALDPRFPQLRHDIEATIINKTLRKSLLEHFEQGRTIPLLHELEDYYHLAPNYISTFYSIMEPDEAFARNTLSYLQKHSHKPNWPLRYVLKTEGIDPAIKKEIRLIIKKGSVPFDQTDRALALLQTAYKQYKAIVKESMSDEYVQATVDIYQYLGEELEAFTTQYKRPPSFGRKRGKERDLFNMIIALVYNHEINRFEQAEPYIRKIYDLLERFPSPCFPEEDTLKELAKFIEKYDDLPRGVHERDFLNPRPNEDLIYESMLYWMRNSASFREKRGELLLRHDKRENDLPPAHYY